MAEDKIIEIENLTKSFGDIKAVSGLNLNVFRGDVFGFLGPNGAGKSTTIRMMLSLIKPDRGTIKLFGNSLPENYNSSLKSVGAIVEKPDFYKYLSAYQNLELLSRISGKEISKKRIMETLEIVGLAERYKSKVKTFSHGMKQRLGIAQAIMHDPELVVLDEPTIGLDPHGMKEIRNLILELSKNQKKTVFLSSHILSEVELVADRMIIIDKGKTVVEGDVSELLNSDSIRVLFGFVDAEKVLELLVTTEWNDKIQNVGKNEIEFGVNQEEISELNKYLVDNGISVNKIVPTRSLEEYFLKITSGAR